MHKPQRIGLPLGALGFALLLLLPAPAGLSPEGWRTAAVAFLMAAWWVTEAIPIPATALLPLVLFPLLGIADMRSAAAPYADDLVFLSMGGFFLAGAMERWGLHRRIALAIIARVGTSPSRLVLGFMLASAFMSMWISNTATTAMMLPIALAVGELFRDPDRERRYPFGICLMLGIAYAATIGGVSTIIGTPTNVLLIGQARELLGIEVGFLEWMVVGVPLTAVLLPVGWLLLTRLFPPGTLRGDAAEVLARERQGLGKMSRGEAVVAGVFVATALAWMLRQPVEIGSVRVPGLQDALPWIRDSTIAVAASLVLFAWPVDLRRGEFALDWATASRIPWGVLLLFGGGFSLASAMAESGLAAWIGGHVAALDAVPPWVALVAVAALFVFLTEITSNAATATMAMPVMAGAASGLGIAPFALMAAAALSCSMAFMLPVATPPNALVFGSGYLRIPDMARAGLALNLLAIPLVTLAAAWLVPLIA